MPDRETIQRLLMRCGNMKDDLAELDLDHHYHDADEGHDGSHEQTL